MSGQPFSILFVCLGNICRSPLAEGVMRHKIEEADVAQRFRLDSAGTGAWHVGNPADSRSIAVGAKNGVELSDLRARQVRIDDYYDFDLILAMDQSNLQDLQVRAPIDASAQIELYRDFCGQGEQDVPDPYYGGADGFDQVFAMIDQASDVLLRRYS